jgi:hypothetical protein
MESLKCVWIQNVSTQKWKTLLRDTQLFTKITAVWFVEYILYTTVSEGIFSTLKMQQTTRRHIRINHNFYSYLREYLISPDCLGSAAEYSLSKTYLRLRRSSSRLTLRNKIPSYVCLNFPLAYEYRKYMLEAESSNLTMMTYRCTLLNNSDSPSFWQAMEHQSSLKARRMLKTDFSKFLMMT